MTRSIASWARWFPDGKRILFSADEPGKGVRLYVQDLNGNPPKAIPAEGVNGACFAISPDGKQSGDRWRRSEARHTHR